MAKQFDATIKMLLEAHPQDWLTLRYGRDVIERLFTGVRSMKESVIYQAIGTRGASKDVSRKRGRCS